jgi:hypothetical protein
VANYNLSPETVREIEKLAAEMGQQFSPPEFIPGCEVLSIADKDEYDTDNGWIEARCGRHNNQRCRWKAKFYNVQVGDYVDVLYFRSIQFFEVFAKGGSGGVNGLPVTTKGDILGYSTQPTRVPVSGNDGYVATEDSTDPNGWAWKPPVALGVYYYHHDADPDIAGYEQAELIPADGTEVIESVSLVAGDGEVSIDPYISQPTTGIGVTLLPGGVWQFIIFGYVDSLAGGDSRIRIRVYKRDTGGTETELTDFDIYVTLTESVTEHTVTSVQQDIPWVATDRIVFKVLGETDSVASKTIYWYYDGNDHYSHVHTPILVPSTGGSGDGWPFAKVWTVSPTNADADFSTITLAIAGAAAGDAILLDVATYSESVTLNKKLYLIGISREGCIISGAVTSTVADCVLKNLTIYRADAGASDVTCFAVGEDVKLKDVIIDGTTVTTTGWLYGVYDTGSYIATLENVQILLADANSSETAGVYADEASAVINVTDGKIDAQTSGGTATDVKINEDGTINLRDPDLVNGTLDAGGGSITGQYRYNDNIIQLDGDVYPGGDTAGLFERVNSWKEITYHFRTTAELSSNFTWDAVNFSGTPNNISIPANSILRMYDTTGTNTFFAYRTLDTTGSAFINMYSQVSITGISANYAWAGIRYDNPAAPTTNYLQIAVYPGTGAGTMKIVVTYNIGGGTVTITYGDGIAPAMYFLRLAYSKTSTIGIWYYGLPNTPFPAVLSSAGSFWNSTTVRAGLIFAQVGSAGATGQAGLWDNWTEVV